MKIDGKKLATQIHNSLKPAISHLLSQNVHPTLAILLIGDNPASRSYIRQKQLQAQELGIRIILNEKPETISANEVENLLSEWNKDKNIHGIIVQRPLPSHLAQENAIPASSNKQKDADGFLPNSLFETPVALAVLYILTIVVRKNAVLKKPAESSLTDIDSREFINWLKQQAIVIIGRGETAGIPIRAALEKRGCTTSVIHSQTPSPESILKKADIIISCVGKQRIIQKKDIKPGSILISAGLTRGDDGKLHGDYEEEEIQNKASYYTPTPGGVGPVNVACLMANVIKAAENSIL